MALTPLDRFLLGAYDRAGSRPKLRRLLLHAMRLLHLARGALGGWQPGRYKARLALSLLLSLAFHAFILSLQFGYAGFGLPGLALPWAERRAHSWDLTVRLVARPVVPAPSPVPAEIAPERKPVAVEPVRPPARTLAATTRAKPVQPPVEARPPVPKREPPKLARAKGKRDRDVPVRREPRPEVIVQADPQQETFSVPPPAPVETKPPPEVVARAQPEEDVAAAKEREQTAQKREEEESARRAREQEEARQLQEAQAAREALALEAQRQAEEAARQQALALERQRAIEEARRQEEARKQEEAKAAREALALEAQRKAEEEARQQTLALERQRALELEAQRQAEEVARQRELEARKQEEARKLEEARKQDEARRQAEELAARARAQEAAERAKADALAAAQREGERAAQAPSRVSGGAIGGSADKPAAGLAGRELAAKALEQLRTPGAVRPEPPRPPVESADPSRRRSVLGSTDRDISVRMYVDSWRWKVERNGNLNFPPAARSRASESPVITVAIRKDGSLEGVYVNRSSGMRSLDDAVRRIVELYAPYSAFPPELARQYDVIEIRRVWFFSNTPNTLRLLEDLPSQ